MIFEWDDNKDRSNFEKHGVSFSETLSIFKNDSNALSVYDENHSTEEDRWVTLGLSDKGNMLVVIHTFTEKGKKEIIRIIPARKADNKEEKQYYYSKGEQ